MSRWAFAFVLLGACAGTLSSVRPPVGVLTREAIVASEPAWAVSVERARPDAAAALALRSVPEGARVRIVLGTWCGDSQREVGRFWKALDMNAGPLPFTMELIAVDRDKRAPGTLLDGLRLERVPTFIVIRDGQEVGRVVESSPRGIERDLDALLRGTRRGVLSARPGF